MALCHSTLRLWTKFVEKWQLGVIQIKRLLVTQTHIATFDLWVGLALTRQVH